MKQKWIDAFMDTAERFAQLSSAKRLQVGAVVVRDQRIVSIGYNGTPAGWTNQCEGDDGKTKDEVIHAEMNCIAKLASSNESARGAVMFITHSPCIHCASIIAASGISKIYYRNAYRSDDGITHLEKCGVEIEKC